MNLLMFLVSLFSNYVQLQVDEITSTITHITSSAYTLLITFTQK